MWGPGTTPGSPGAAFNRRGARPWMEIALDGKKRVALTTRRSSARWDGTRRDSPHGRNRGRSTSRPNTALAFGGSIQDARSFRGLRPIPDRTSMSGPARAHRGPGQWPRPGDGRRRTGLQAESGGPARDGGRPAPAFGAGSSEVDVVSVFGKGSSISEPRRYPYAPSGLAAGSLVSFLPNATDASTRLVAGTDDDVMVIALCSMVRRRFGITRERQLASG